MQLGVWHQGRCGNQHGALVNNSEQLVLENAHVRCAALPAYWPAVLFTPHASAAADCSCSSANGMQQKLYNWNTLNSKVLKRLGLQLTKQHMQEIALCTPGAIEQALQVLKLKIAAYQEPR
jgi:hypothetical protein